MTTMKAARVHEWGGPEVVQIEDIPIPEPNSDEILVRVRAAGVNPVDWKTREGYRKAALSLPTTLGRDISGEVVAVGSGIQRFKVGDAVYGMINKRGAFAEYTTALEEEVALKPLSVDHVQAAAVPMAALTSWQALFDIADLKAGQKVLIQGAAGGLGAFAVQLARWKGAYVVGTASAANESFLADLGVDQYIDYRTTRFEDVVQDADVVFDTVGSDTLERSYHAVKPGGILVTSAGQPSPENAGARGIRAARVQVQPRPDQLVEIARIIDSGDVKPVVSTILPLSQVREALQQSQSGHTRGKIVLEIP